MSVDAIEKRIVEIMREQGVSLLEARLQVQSQMFELLEVASENIKTELTAA